MTADTYDRWSEAASMLEEAKAIAAEEPSNRLAVLVVRIAKAYEAKCNEDLDVSDVPIEVVD